MFGPSRNFGLHSRVFYRSKVVLVFGRASDLAGARSHSIRRALNTHVARSFVSSSSIPTISKVSPLWKRSNGSNAILEDHSKAASTSTTWRGHNPLPDFDDSKAAFESKSTKQLLRAALSFGMCRIPFLVRNAESMLALSRRVFGDYLTDQVLLKGTLFGHFCAGENEHEIQQPIQALQKAGIGSILDYAAEDDVSESGKSSAKIDDAGNTKDMAEQITADRPPVGRVYDYESEAKCDRHVKTFRKCIRDVASLQSDGFAAVKVTALCNPKLLQRMSRAIVEAQNLFGKFDLNKDGFISREEFEYGFRVFFKDDAIKLKEMLEQVRNPSDSQMIDYISWSMLLRPEDLPRITSGCREIGPLAMATPTDEEVELISKMYERGHALAQEAVKYGTRLLIDAEQARFQPAIDSLVLDLQRMYNTTTTADFPIIYNTYQCYLKDVKLRIKTDMERSERYGYHFGAKLVRGAYMESERALAEAFGYPSPIHDTIEDTHASYNDLARFLLECAVKRSGKETVEVMLATHNQESVEKAICAMNELGVDRLDPIVSFGQLYGMKDNLTYNLGKHGFRAYKYVPYGEVKMVMPYLIRRANENSSVAGSASTELTMILHELLRRVKKGFS